MALASVTILFQGFFSLSYNAFVGLDGTRWGALLMVLPDTAKVILLPVLIIAGFGVAVVNLDALIGVVATPVAIVLLPAFLKLDVQSGKDDLKRMLELSVRYM